MWLVWFALYGLSVVAANFMVSRFEFWPVGFGFTAPAGVYAAGLSFTFRDLLQDAKGRRATWIAICLGAVVSALLPALSARVALASATAFLVSEAADYLVYTPLRRRGWLRAVAASNVVGLAVDSALFLWLAFGSLTFLWGQVWGKVWVTALAVAMLWAWRRMRRALSDEHLPAAVVAGDA